MAAEPAAAGVAGLYVLVALLGQLPVPQLRRLSAMLSLRFLEARWTATVKHEQVIHILAGKLRATLHAFSVFVDQRNLDEEKGGRARP